MLDYLIDTTGYTQTGAIYTFTTEETIPNVVAISPLNVDDTSATIRGVVQDLKGLSEVDVTFEYKLSNNTEWTSLNPQTITSEVSFSDSLENLSIGTSYDYRILVEYGVSSSYYTNTQTFSTTDPDAPELVSAINDINLVYGETKTQELSDKWSGEDNIYLMYIDPDDSSTITVNASEESTNSYFTISLSSSFVVSVTAENKDISEKEVQVIACFGSSCAQSNFNINIAEQPPTPIIPDGTFEDFFDIFTGGSTSMKFVVGLVLIIGMVIMGFNTLKSFMGALLFGIFGLVLSVILGLIGIWVVILIIILAILPIIYKLSFGNVGGV